ncbi:hypothetical protein [Streptomyces sp. NBC_00576]|uniref:hypothetical protein n=1 Tax=Streptomyces sp. NBC_00576 TaxID=2903665 RepID=UPI002E81615F|nr:hypothetical protein [Streptomyces sp. NBC_00576]WUB68770.1 hypothetical protein OG734_00910 [Streptomyces sp. NBC_00576]
MEEVGGLVVSAYGVAPVVGAGQRVLRLTEPGQGGRAGVGHRGGGLLAARECHQSRACGGRGLGGGVGEFQALLAVAQMCGLQAHAAQGAAVGDVVFGGAGEFEGAQVVLLAQALLAFVHGHPAGEVHEVRDGGAHVGGDAVGSAGAQVGARRC